MTPRVCHYTLYPLQSSWKLTAIRVVFDEGELFEEPLGRLLRQIAQSTLLPRHWQQEMADQNDVDLDSIIDRLLEVRGSRPGKQVQLLETEIRYLCTKAREIFISQPILLELEAPIKANIFLPQFSPTHFTTLKHQVADIDLRRSDLWRHTWPILRSSPPLRVRRIPPRSELSFPWGLCGSR